MEKRERSVGFHVPINELGEKEMEYMDYIETHSQNIKYYLMTFEENRLLVCLYLAFNDEFNIIIDDYENETMKKEDVPKALEMAIAFKEKSSDENTKQAVDKIIEILTFAKEHNSLVEFWF